MIDFHFTVEGEPHGKDRPRVRVVVPKGGRPFATFYTPKETEQAEARVAGAWREAGSQTVQGAFRIVVEISHERPKGHFKVDGVSLSAEGRRHPHPENQKPDVDNVLKLVMDALNGEAWDDDVAAIDAHCTRRWSSDGERVKVWISEVGGDG